MGLKNQTKYKNKFIVGSSIGRYTIINSDIIIDREAKITCQCACGVIRLVSCYSLIKGTSTQCSVCGNSLKRNNNPAWKGVGEVAGRIYSKLKRDAFKRDLEFTITLEFLDELYKKQGHKCALTGLDLDMKFNHLTASVDRINNDKGYIEGNVQWVHKDINMMKRIYNQDYFIEMCKLVAEFKNNSN